MLKNKFKEIFAEYFRTLDINILSRAKKELISLGAWKDDGASYSEIAYEFLTTNRGNNGK